MPIAKIQVTIVDPDGLIHGLDGTRAFYVAAPKGTEFIHVRIRMEEPLKGRATVEFYGKGSDVTEARTD